MRVLGIWLLILAAWVAVVAVAFGQDVQLRKTVEQIEKDAKALGIPRIPALLREELTPTDPLLESGWTREKDGSYVRTFRRPAPPKATAPTPQARPEAQPRKLTTARSVPVQTFPGGVQFDPDHQCNRCGAFQYEIAGFNADGSHSHRCQRCGNVWKH